MGLFAQDKDDKIYTIKILAEEYNNGVLTLTKDVVQMYVCVEGGMWEFGNLRRRIRF